MEKYLHKYAEPETAALAGLPAQEPWANVLVIPACNETAEFLRPPPPCSGRSLMILVINESESARQEVSTSNRNLAATVQANFELQWQSTQDSGLSLFNDPRASRDVLLVDRFSEGHQLPVKGGVGHARKIGADLAASLIHTKRIHSHWIHCSDGDVQLPSNYFTCSSEVRKSRSEYSALIYPYHHCNNEGRDEDREVMLATQLYELSLRYYVAGMKFAGSPYAFHTIGSTMAVSANHYAKVRGFPKRDAGEDFYLLNKLAKVGPVLELDAGPDCEPVRIEARRSNRVPFGTGAAVNKITALTDPVKEFRFYHPGVFELLSQWLNAVPRIWVSQSPDLDASIFADHPGQWQELMAGLNEIRVRRALDHAFRQSKSEDQFARQVHTWFDAFRTLKLIHFLRDHYLPSISFGQLEATQVYYRIQQQDSGLKAYHDRMHQLFQLSPQAKPD